MLKGHKLKTDEIIKKIAEEKTEEEILKMFVDILNCKENNDTKKESNDKQTKSSINNKKSKKVESEKIEKKVYSNYAFGNYYEARKINYEIYEELKKKWKISGSKNVEFSDYDLIYTKNPEYGRNECTILKNNTDMSDDELALIFDGGNLCFGYSKKSNNLFYIFID